MSFLTKDSLVEKISILELFILFLTLMTIKLPDSFYSFSTTIFILSILVVINNRKLIKIDSTLRNIFFGFFIFIFIFCIFSIDQSLSFKGLYDVFRAFIYFLVAIVFFTKISKYDYIVNYFLFSALILILGNYYFDRGSFYGYFINPNNVAIEVFIISSVSLALFKKNNKLNILLCIIIFVSSLILLIEANSRNILLGIFIGSLIILNVMIRSYKVIFYQIVVLLIFLFYFILYNHKGYGLSSREDIWIPLISNTIDNHLFFGTGFNTVKLIILELNSITQTAHNIFIEIFTSTGIVGLTIFIYLCYKLYIHIKNLDYEINIMSIIGVFGLISMIVFFQFDLKFASKPFLGMFFIFLGLLYTQRKIGKEK